MVKIEQAASDIALVELEYSVERTGVVLSVLGLVVDIVVVDIVVGVVVLMVFDQ